MITPKNEISELLSIVPAILYEYAVYNDNGEDSEFLFLTPNCKEILGFHSNYFLEDMRNFWERVHPDDVPRLITESDKARRLGKLFWSEVRFFRSDNKEIWIRLSSKRTQKKYRNDYIWAGYITDITARKRAEAKLEYTATHDDVTGLFNRKHLFTTLKQVYQRASRYSRELSLLMIDLDHFKQVNDKYGHLSGDKALIECASKIQSEIREFDFCGRFGGEEFLVILPDTSTKDALEVAERIRLSIENLIIEDAEEEIRLTASIGVACLSKSSTSHTELVGYADQALYKAKSTGRNCVKEFEA